MNVSDWLSLTLVCILGAASPGPSFAVILSATRTGGRAGGLAAALGHGLGIFLYAFVAATSLSLLSPIMPHCFSPCSLPELVY